MRLTSGKFKHLETIDSLLKPGTIPAFKIISHAIDLPEEISGPGILRSSLRNEASKQKLLSGKSLSISDIDSRQKLLEAWEQVSRQENLDEVIFQHQVQWEKHLTVIYSGDLIFAEIKRSSGGQSFIYWTPLAQSLEPEVAILREFFAPLKSYLRGEKYWLFELGLLQKSLYLFQLHSVDEGLLGTIFSSDLVAQVVSSRVRFSKKQTLWQLLKTELSARKFRAKVSEKNFEASYVFLNWEYLFHYFRLFCMLNRKKPSAEAFASFLNQSYRSGWPGALVKKHLELSSHFRSVESYTPMKVGFEDNGLIFLGRGELTGIIGDDIFFAPEIPLSMIYQSSKPRVILTSEVSILSHLVLASVENGIFLVLGVKGPLLRGDRIFLDFDQKQLKVN